MNVDGLWTEPDSDPRNDIPPGTGEKGVLDEA